MNGPGPTRPRTPAGFTLVELLIALVLAGLVAALLVGLYGLATRTVFDQQQRARGPHAAALALDQLQADLGRAFLRADDTNDLFTLENGGTSRTDQATAQLAFLTFDPLAEGDPDWAVCRRVRYRVEPGNPPALLRIHQPLSGPGSLDPPLTNVLLRGLDTFTVELFDGVAWQEVWAGQPAEARRPQAARITIGDAQWRGQHPTQRAEFMIPAGLGVTSTVIRTGGRM